MSILKIGMYASNRIGAIPEQNYLTFSSDAPFSIKFNEKRWDGVLEYSLDAENWYEWDASEINSSDNTLYLRGSGNTVITNSSDSAHAMKMTSPSESGIVCTGNIMTLLDHVSPETAVMGVRCFARMFYQWTNLTAAPELPATTLAAECYRAMFYQCTNLEVAPELPATVLAPQCYRAMFQAAGIVVAPELPATTLAENCYRAMLYGTGIAISKTQTGAYQTPWRIPSAGTIVDDELVEWNVNMLGNTSGTFTGDPAINTTYYQAN